MTDGIKNKDLIEKKEKQIALGATKIFIERGFHKTSVREIARHSNLTIGNLYDYIKTKDDVLYIVFKEFHKYWSRALLDDPRILKTADPREQLQAAIESMLDLACESRDLVILAYRETKSLRKDYLKEVLWQESKLVGYFEHLIRRGIELGSFRKVDATLAANTLVFLLALIPLRGWNFMETHDEQQVKRFVIDFFLAGILEKQTGKERFSA